MSAAFESISAGTATDADWEALTPMSYGRWDAEAVVHHAAEEKWRNEVAADVFNADGAFDPTRTRAALGEVAAPVLVLAGELDWVTSPAVAAEFAGLFPKGELGVQRGAGHFPWL